MPAPLKIKRPFADQTNLKILRETHGAKLVCFVGGASGERGC